MNALVVEDLQLDQKLFGAILKSCNVEHQFASTKAAALQALSSTRFDVAILDYKLPDGTAAEIVEWVKAHQPDLLRRVAVITALSPAEVSDLPEEVVLFFKPISSMDVQVALLAFSVIRDQS